VGKRGYEAMEKGFRDLGMMVMLRITGETIGAVAAADHQGRADRRDLREGPEGDPEGGELTAAVEGLALGGHLLEQLRRREARAVFLLEGVAERDEVLGAHEVDVGQRAAGERREAEAEDRADVRLAHVGDDVILDGARRFQRLHHQEAVLQLLDVERIRIELLRLQRGEARPEALLPRPFSG
jgi:hypothetical protein